MAYEYEKTVGRIAWNIDGVTPDEANTDVPIEPAGVGWEFLAAATTDLRSGTVMTVVWYWRRALP